jgi:hypothetical protein
MTTLPSPPPSPVFKRCHRRNDSYMLVQAIIKENERIEQEDHAHTLKEAQSIHFSPCKTEKESILVQKSKSTHSVRFATEPPKVYHYGNDLFYKVSR